MAIYDRIVNAVSVTLGASAMANDFGKEFGVLHLIGPDRVGILQDAAAFVGERGGVTEESISHTLSTEAVVLLFVSGNATQLDLIQRDTPTLGKSLKLLSLFSRISNDEREDDRDALPLTLRVSSPDFAGLLAAMTRFFTKHGLKIVAHHTHKSELPVAQGSFTYSHRFTVLLPPEFNRKTFLVELDELAQEAKFMRDAIAHSDFY